MQSLNINQLVIDGLAPLSYASQHVVHHILDTNILKEPSINDISKLSTHIFKSRLFTSDASIPFDDFSQQSVSSDTMVQKRLAYSSFLNKNMTILLRSALISGAASFRRTLHDYKMTHKRIFAQELNQQDKNQNTLLWYLTVAGLYSSIEELYRLASVELNINVKNGSFNQTILHYAVIHGNMEEIRIILDIGVDTNLQDRFGRTALHYIALYGTKQKNDVEIAKLLIDRGILPKYELKNF
jgi:ankyrin repeat protein